MKYLILLCFAVSTPVQIFGQTFQPLREGVVSYITSQNIYVRFQLTDGMTAGDTLFKREPAGSSPVLVLRYISSTSVVGIPIAPLSVQVGDTLQFKPGNQMVEESRSQERLPDDPSTEHTVSSEVLSMDHTDLRTQIPNFKGRIGIGSYLNYSNGETEGRQHMRYSLSLSADRMGGSRFSADSYIIFRHQVNEWEKVRNNLATALKVYNLALTYQTENHIQVSVGRKINRHISNVGAIDGLQLEKTTGTLTFGLVGGTRPDYADYSLNLDQIQFGAYINHSQHSRHGTVETSFAILEQKYQSKTDRRFVYFQHSNALVRNLHFFGSVEMDWYQKQNDVVTHNLRPTSFYFSLRYRPSRKISFTASFDSRRNVIYYETFKSLIDQLIEEETRQGFRFRFHYRPFNSVVLGASAGYRTQRDNPNDSRNLYSYITFTQIPYLKTSATISSTFVRSNYLQGNIYRVGLHRDILKKKLHTELSYRILQYTYGSPGTTLDQQMVGTRVTSNFNRKLTISVNYEVTFQKTTTLSRIYANVIQRI